MAPRPTILVVEDEPEIRRFLRAAFGVEGYRTVESASGRRGSIDAGTHKPDLAIVDLALPDIDGVEVIRRIREWSSMTSRKSAAFCVSRWKRKDWTCASPPTASRRSICCASGRRIW